MDWINYSVDGQISMFDLMETETSSFNPLEELALHGTGVVDGMKRVTEYFSKNHTMAEKASFLKKEYGLGGFGSPVKKPCYIHSMDTFGHSKKDVVFSYYDEDMKNIDSSCGWMDLEKTITNMISKGTYKK